MSYSNDIIDISFDDQPKKDAKGNDIIDVEINSGKNNLDIDVNPENKSAGNNFVNEINEPEKHAATQEDIISSEINSYYRGNASLTGKYNSDMEYPEGIGITFRKKFISLLKDDFLNGLLENNNYLAAASRHGNIYLIDRFSGAIKSKMSPANSVFEKTGCAIRNVFYINSVKSIFEINTSNLETGKSDLAFKEIYTASADSFIWSNLNSKGDEVFFLTYSPSTGKASFNTLNISDYSYYEYEFIVEKELSDSVCLAGDFFCFFYDDKLVKCSAGGSAEEQALSINLNFSFPVICLNYKLFCLNELNEIFYCDLSEKSSVWKYTGIRSDHITSFTGADDNLFVGMLNGWKAYKTSGTEFFSFDEDSEMKVECLSNNLLAASKGNKIIFYNLKRFAEAEGYIAGTGNRETGEIKCAMISFSNIFILTAKGTVECFSPDNLNIHI